MPVIVTESFVVHPGQRLSCADLCRSVREAAMRNPACLSFRVLHDRHQPEHIAIVSEWKNMESFNGFVRGSGLMWLERGMHPPLVGTWSFLHPFGDRGGIFDVPA
jgi:hypothetical protein